MLRLIYCGQFRNVQIILFLFSLLSDCSEFFLYTSIYWIVLTATQKYSLLYWYMKQFSEKVRFSQFIIFLAKLLFTFFQIMFILSRLVSTGFFLKYFMLVVICYSLVSDVCCCFQSVSFFCITNTTGKCISYF